MNEQPTEAPTQSNTSVTTAGNQHNNAEQMLSHNNKNAIEISSITSNTNEAPTPEKMQTDQIPSAPITGYSNNVAANNKHENAALIAAEAQHAANVAAVANAVAVATATANAAATAANTANAAAAQASAATPAERPAMADWSVAEVCEFIRHLPGCTDYVDDFEQQEIDGQALMLLKENHLVNAMGMKLGPALKIVAKVESMKEQAPAPNADKESQQ